MRPEQSHRQNRFNMIRHNCRAHPYRERLNLYVLNVEILFQLHLPPQVTDGRACIAWKSSPASKMVRMHVGDKHMLQNSNVILSAGTSK